MMSRSLPEWVGRTDDSPIPPRVRLRVLDRFSRRCDGCGRSIAPGVAWACDHVTALVNGGRNREGNLHPLCAWCHPGKTGADLAEKSKVYDLALRHAGIRLRPRGRPLPGTVASGWRRRMDGRWERRP